MKTQFVSDLKVDDAVNDIFVLMEKSVSLKKDGNRYLNVVIADKTGHIKGVVWDNLDQITAAGISSGDFVHVIGLVNEYRGDVQLVIKKMAGCPIESLNSADFLPATNQWSHIGLQVLHSNLFG